MVMPDTSCGHCRAGGTRVWWAVYDL